MRITSHSDKSRFPTNHPAPGYSSLFSYLHSIIPSEDAEAPKYEVPNLLPKIEIGDSSKIVLYSTVELMSCEIHIRSASFSTFL